MKDYKLAEELYLRGYGGSVILEQSSVSIQSLLKVLLNQNVKYSNDDRIDYQIQYIHDNYGYDEIVDGYLTICNLDNIEKLAHSRKINVLGCGFGAYKRVFVTLLGKDQYNELRNASWKRKQEATMIRKYGVSNAFSSLDKFTDNDTIINGRKKRQDTMLLRYGVKHPLQNPDLKLKAANSYRSTMLSKYGVLYPSQIPEVARKITNARQATMLQRYGVANSVEDKHIRDSIFEARRINGTLNTSLPEKVLGDILREKFGDDDVLYNKVIDARYPWHVDYYIKSLDLFIELNGDPSHNTHWYEFDSNDDSNCLSNWKAKAELGKSRYISQIRTWTKSDVEKRQMAKKNRLNYLVFWDGTCSIIKGKRVPNLSDVYEWLDAGCPLPQKWHAKNTY